MYIVPGSYFAELCADGVILGIFQYFLVLLWSKFHKITLWKVPKKHACNTVADIVNIRYIQY